VKDFITFTNEQTNFLFDGSDLLAPDPGLFLALGLATRPGNESDVGKGSIESPFSCLASA